MRAAANKHQVRIIGGRFRGRRLPVPDQPGLRPTTDRVRETLFNWLAPVIEGARCLDAFSGSGALGFEAASRGAASVVMLEQAGPVARQLQANARTLGAVGLQVVCADTLQWLGTTPRTPFDVVFLDPPFAAGLLEPALHLLLQEGWLNANARLYLESAREQEFPALPPAWELVREKCAGQVRYGLVAPA